MFNIDIFKNLEPLKIYLSKPDGTLLYCLNSFIDKESAQLSPKFNSTYDISFNIYRHIDDRKGNLLEFIGYDYIVDGMYLSIEKYGNFRILNPEVVNSADNEYKIVTATSCDCELKQTSFSYQINMGLETSLEYLIEYEEGEKEKIVDPYTGIPYDWILLYNTIPEQLTTFKTKLDSGHFGTFSDSIITVSNQEQIEEILYILDLVKRLKRTIVYDDTGNVISSTENFEYVYNDDNEIIKIVIYDTINSRLTDVITYYEKYHKQLSLLDFISNLTDGNWTIGEICGLSDGDYTYANKKIQFDEDGTLYSFLTQSLARAIECVPLFDLVNRTISVQPVEQLGIDTGGVIGFNKLVNSLHITCDENELITKLYVYGENQLSISQVNFGREYIEDLTYMVNSVDENGNRIYVSDELAEKYLQYKEYQEANRSNYISLTKKYNQYLKDIDELKYRVPNDSLSTNWGSFSLEDLNTELTTYKNLLNSLISLYKEDYGSNGCNADGSVSENYIKNTEYWYDYYAYNGTIKQIEVAINTYPNYNNESRWTETQKAQYEGIKDNYLTEWSLYGSVELKAKISSYQSRLEILVSSNSVIKDGTTEYGIKSWNELSSLEKEDYLTEKSYTDSYDMYMEYYNCMINAQSFLDTILADISTLETEQNAIKENLTDIKNKVSWEIYFTSSERKILNKLLYDGEYNNNNIIVTSVNDVVDSVDISNDLLLDGQERLSILSRPQLIFTTELNNVFGLIEFKQLWDNFKLANFILVQYKDNRFAKLRLTGFSFNPLIPSTNTMSVTFSNMVASKTKFGDSANILGLSSTEGISTYGSKSSSSVNTSFDTTISNTMLEKLLNSESFGTRVNNVILDTMALNLLEVKKVIVGNSAGDNTEIDGKRVTTGWIMSGGYNGNKNTGSINNTKGSILNLENDCFNLGGGSLIYDGTTLRFGSDVSISWYNISDTDDVANKNDIPTNTSQLNNDSGYQTASQVTQITKDTVTTSYVNALNITAKRVDTDWVYAGDIDADQIKTGTLDATKITVVGLEVGNNVTMGANATISWSNVSGTDNVATKNYVNDAITEAGGMTEEQVTEITRTTISTSKIKASQIYGDTLTLGGSNNASGCFVINDASGNPIVTGDNSGLIINKGKIAWTNVTGTDDVATTDDIPTKTSELTNDSDYQTATQVTTITKDTVTTSYVEALNITAKKLAATTGTIGGWNIATNYIYNSQEGGSIYITSAKDSSTYWIRTHNAANGAGTRTFSVSKTGVLYATGADISGKITATSGKIGDWTIGSAIYYSNGGYTLTATTANTAYIGVDGLNFYNSDSAYFRVTRDTGQLTAAGADISGKITATSGVIGGFTINSSSLFNGCDSITSTTNGVYIGTNGIRTVGNYGYTTIKEESIKLGNKDDNRYVALSSNGIGLYTAVSGSSTYPVEIRFYKNNNDQGHIDEQGVLSSIDVFNDGFDYYGFYWDGLAFFKCLDLEDCMYMGRYTDNEKSLYFTNYGDEKYKHNSRVYGGGGSSKIAIGFYDDLNNRPIWIYNDVENKIDSDSQLGYGPIPVTQNTTNVTEVTSDIRFYPFLRMVMFSARFTVTAFNAGDSRQLGTIPSAYAPATVTAALQAHCNVLAASREMSAYCNTDGNIQISVGAAVAAGKYIYLSGVWNY